MKAGIVYFSGTGVTGYVARLVADGLRTEGVDVDLVRFTKGISFPVEDYDIIGVGAPTYSFYPPRLFLKFLKTLPASPGKPFFIVNTSHHLQGITVRAMYSVLAKKGWRLSAAPLLVRGVNNIRSWRFQKLHGKPRDELYGLEEIGPLVQGLVGGNPAGGAVSDQTLRVRPGLSFFSALFTYSWMMAAVEGFHKRVDPEKCTRCGLCAEKFCPAGAVRINGTGYPRIKNRACIGCSSCINLCPAEAVITGSSRKRWPLTKFRHYL